jgi:spore maturation protein CgeB
VVTSEDDNISLMQKSIFVPDFRPQEQKDNLYVPCRVLKAISYGCLAVSDAPYLKNFIDDSLLVSGDAQEIFDLGMQNKYNKDLILHQMEVVKRDHTYINRCKGLLKIVDKINEK